MKEFSDVFNKTRHLALHRIAVNAKKYVANAVIGIVTHVLPFQGVHEMLMMGTACYHPQLPPVSDNSLPVTSDMTAEETWNLAASFSRGEATDLTTLIYDAREHGIGLIREEAKAIGADDVVGIRTHIHELGNLLEFMAVGTAVKRVANMAPQSPALPAQAIIRDKQTWITGPGLPESLEGGS